MPAYTYDALDANGKARSGVLEAENAKAARQQLRGRELVQTRYALDVCLPRFVQLLREAEHLAPGATPPITNPSTASFFARLATARVHVLDPTAERLRRGDADWGTQLAAWRSDDPLVRAATAVRFFGLREWQPVELVRTASGRREIGDAISAFS